MCGERLNALAQALLIEGSSPRVRGTPRRSRLRGTVCRFIPACAGNAVPSRLPRLAAPVHPRVCGERGNRSNDMKANYGSSPRVRGTRRGGARPGRLERFIPACAGNADTWIRAGTAGSVHPRVCGERLMGLIREYYPNGSSPRVRGTHQPAVLDRRAWRFIPACAGNASRRSCRPTRRSVHPRVCGERSCRNSLISKAPWSLL